MLVPVNVSGRMYLALAIPRINNRADVKLLRNAPSVLTKEGKEVAL